MTKQLVADEISPKEDEYLDKLVRLLFDKAYDELQKKTILNFFKTRKTSKK